MDQYGGTLAPDLRSGIFTTNNVTIKVTLSRARSADEQDDSETPAPEA